MKGLFHMFGRRPDNIDREVEARKAIFLDELARLEALAIDSRVRGRRYDDGDSKPDRDNMDPNRNRRGNDTQ